MFDYDFEKTEEKSDLARSKSVESSDHRSKNEKVYGKKTPPMYPTDLLKDYPIVMISGKTDRICSPDDYVVLKDLLEK